MKEFKGRVAVITGAGSGIGRGLAERCAQEGMKVVLADVNEKGLAETESDLRAKGTAVIAVRTDVAKAAEVDELAKRTVEAFGGVHLLFNNAGVGVPGSIWETSQKDWEWQIGVNLWGVINGIRSFVPTMLSQDSEGHIVNTASVAGLMGFNICAAYMTTKFAVVGLSEHLYHSLVERNAKIRASVLCPGMIRTNIFQSFRNRPAGDRNDPLTKELEAYMDRAHQTEQERGMPPSEVAEIVFKAIREEKFYIFTHPESKDRLQVHVDNLLAERNPVP